jgi:stage II sporulation protein D
MVAALLVVSAGAAPLTARADSVNDQLAALQAQEANQRSTLNQLGGQQAAARAILNQLRGELGAKQADYAAIHDQAQALTDRISAFEARENDLLKDHEEHVRKFSLEVRGLYKTGPLSALTFLFGADSFSDFLDRTIYLSRLSKANYDRAEALRREREDLQQTRTQSQALRAELEPLLQAAAAKLAEAQSTFNEQAALTSGIESQQRAQLSALLGTQKRERQLEAALAAAQAAANAAAQKGAGRSYGPICPAAPAGKLSFCGHGWGHGVGLAQYGALGMAQSGTAWPQIITSFYSGVGIGAAPAETVRVFLHAAGRTITPRNAGATIQDGAGVVVGNVGQDQAMAMTPNGDGSITAAWPGGSAQARPLRVVPNAGGIFQTNGGANIRYRGEAWLDASTGYKVINHVDLEDYLQGLSEVPSSWPIQAIAAQTVAARTYALYHLGGGLYDVDDTTASQVYGGVDREAASQNQAVAMTRGQAIFYQGSIINAVFSSSDGGHTQCASAEWGSGDNPCTPAYLRGVIDNHDVSPLHTWYTPPHTLAEIQGYLGSTYNAASCGPLTGFDLSNRDASNRLNVVRMVGANGTCTATPGAFIRAINAGSPADFIVYGEMFGTTTGNRGWPYW